uniref:DBP n=1 Tax=Chrysodeixis includens nucleopolyhedrovirus TaxID=1207438 RepID=A0A1C8ZYW8_9ABAC|nr:DBP [Chrysodeixis includens nucleopolyhedrovirus]QGW49155.1 DBP [Chrysodeixis includens nucleopolyhedrovirus]QGW49295.1 DBP [Chrysodeixis includens nucleopolyhedrovirus]QGW49435.1 DBP [Chrysodeixis includens nucleopolyhedrovirus]QGW49575.1 DBP [Chrysodeixis includens nucleopolyhedrovirus]
MASRFNNGSEMKRKFNNDTNEEFNNKKCKEEYESVVTAGALTTVDTDDNQNLEYDVSDNALSLCKTQSSWMSDMINTIVSQRFQNSKIIDCISPYNILTECFGFIRDNERIDNHLHRLIKVQSESKDYLEQLCVVEPNGTSKRNVYEIGMRVKGGIRPFYYFDYAMVKRYRGQYGDSIAIRSANRHVYNEIFGNIMSMHFNEENCKISNIYYYNMGRDYAKSINKFFDISQEHNQLLFSTGKLDKTVKCESFTLERFDEVLKLKLFDNEPPKPSDEVPMFVGSIIEGVKEAQKEESLHLLSGKKIKEKPLSLAIVPMIFFHIKSDDE